MTKSVSKIIISKIIGFMIFLILLVIANVLIPVFNNPFYSEIINFFNSNIILLVMLTLIGLINEIFWSFYFPFNMIAPITGSVLSIYVITFIHNFFDFLNTYSLSNLILPWQTIQSIVFWIVLIAGYITILIRQGNPGGEWHEEMKKRHEKKLRRKREKLKKKIENIDRRLGKRQMKWQDVGNEFKHLFYNLGKSINDLFDKGKKKRK